MQAPDTLPMKIPVSLFMFRRYGSREDWAKPLKNEAGADPRGGVEIRLSTCRERPASLPLVDFNHKAEAMQDQVN